MLGIIVKKAPLNVTFLFDSEGKNKLKNRLGYAAKEKDHALFMLGETLGDLAPKGGDYSTCDFVNIICNNIDDDILSIYTTENGFSAIEMKLSCSSFQLLLTGINSVNNEHRCEQLSIPIGHKDNLTINLSYSSHYLQS